MKKFLVMLASIFMSLSTFANLLTTPVVMFNGEKKTLSDLGKGPFLFVNIATECGFTPQLGDLETLYQKYKAKGFNVVGIPSNDFGGQTPQDGAQIGDFCKKNYGVTFPILEKAVVKGDNKIPLVKELIQGSKDQSEIGWNFGKFLVSKEGKVINRYSSSTKPLDNKLVKEVESLL